MPLKADIAFKFTNADRAIRDLEVAIQAEAARISRIPTELVDLELSRIPGHIFGLRLMLGALRNSFEQRSKGL